MTCLSLLLPPVAKDGTLPAAVSACDIKGCVQEGCVLRLRHQRLYSRDAVNTHSISLPSGYTAEPIAEPNVVEAFAISISEPSN